MVGMFRFLKKTKVSKKVAKEFDGAGWEDFVNPVADDYDDNHRASKKNGIKSSLRSAASIQNTAAFEKEGVHAPTTKPTTRAGKAGKSGIATLAEGSTFEMEPVAKSKMKRSDRHAALVQHVNGAKLEPRLKSRDEITRARQKAIAIGCLNNRAPSRRGVE